LSIGANVVGAERLQSNANLSFMGVTLVGDGFRLTPEEVQLLGFDLSNLPPVIKPYVSGKEISQQQQNRFVIDLFSTERETVLQKYPTIYQWLLERVKPLRDQNKRQAYRDRWWIFGEPRGSMRVALNGLSRYIATLETSKHRFFIMLPSEVVPDHSLFVVAIEDAFALGVLSSRIHVVWSLAAGSTLEDRPRWRNVTCFDPFPFPDCDEARAARIRELGEQLDAHRKRQQAQHPRLTITEMYNVRAALRAGQPLSDRERATHEQGLVSVLKQIHDELDAEVCAAYGWPATLTDEELLQRLVALNAARAAEERAGLVRWLRPTFQHPTGATQVAFDEQAAAVAAAPTARRAKQPWPKTIPEQARAVRQALAAAGRVVTPAQLAQNFMRARTATVAELLQTLAALGQAREIAPGQYAA